jgi:hypothetical protein
MNAVMPVQTCAQSPEADLFGDVEPTTTEIREDLAEVAARLAIRGTLHGRLRRNAEVRSKPCDRQGHMVPVLCLDLDELGGWKRVVHAEQVFTEAQRGHAEKLASTLKRGMVVAVVSPITDVRMTLPHIDGFEVMPQEARP